MLMKRKKVFATALIASGLLSSGCAHYRAVPLRRLSTGHHPINKENIKFAYKIFSPFDCKTFLDRDVIQEGYQPIQLTITNNSPRALKFSARSVSLPCVAPFEVAQKVHTSTVGRVVAWGVPGLFIWPFLIPAVVDGVKSSNANRQLDLDYATKFAANQLIEPYTTLNGLIFVPTHSFTPEFTVTLVDCETRERIVFSSCS
jgi:hypothetical protein